MAALSLISPVGTNFIKDWTAQNEVNCDDIDAFAGPNSLTSHPIGQYTPILTATTTNPVLGAGEIKGFYYNIWDMVYSWGYFKFGTGFSVGSGAYTISLPFTAFNINGFSTSLGLTDIAGSAYLWDESALANRFNVSVSISSTVMFFGNKAGSTASTVTDLVPITWAIDDGIRWSIRYTRLHS